MERRVPTPLAANETSDGRERGIRMSKRKPLFRGIGCILMNYVHVMLSLDMIPGLARVD
jgi:hypothetical protein